MPHQRLRAFLRAGEFLWGIATTGKHMEKWGVRLPERLVAEARCVLRDYPNSLEIESAAVDQRSMHTWMTKEVRDMELHASLYDRLRAAFAEAGMEPTVGEVSDSECFLFEWLSTEHPALGYREPFDVLDVTSNPETIVELFKAELLVSREARRVIQGKRNAYRWLRQRDRSLGAIPLEMLAADAGRRKVMAELHRLAANSKPALYPIREERPEQFNAGRTSHDTG